MLKHHGPIFTYVCDLVILKSNYAYLLHDLLLCLIQSMNRQYRSTKAFAGMQSSTEVEKKNEIRLAVREALTSNKVDSIREHEMDDLDADDHSDDDDEANFDARMRLQILRKRREIGDVATHDKLPAGNVCYLTRCIFMHLINYPQLLMST